MPSHVFVLFVSCAMYYRGYDLMYGLTARFSLCGLCILAHVLVDMKHAMRG